MPQPPFPPGVVPVGHPNHGPPHKPFLIAWGMLTVVIWFIGFGLMTLAGAAAVAIDPGGAHREAFTGWRWGVALGAVQLVLSCVVFRWIVQKFVLPSA
ncbi:hypothetical protein [Botrimarina sp.]|uniref:hypothetical protein n=1 Tax=Botrimarina sp. TaxID=2795802 RepID=UPI0032ECD2BB